MEFTNKHKYVLILFLVVLLLPYLYLFGFVHPIADDLGFGYQAKQAPLLNVLINTYKTSNGLYSGNFFMYLFPFSLTDVWSYRLFLLTNFFLFFSGVFFLINTIFNAAQKTDKLLLSLCVLLAILSSTTHLAEAFYWQTSVVYYQLGLTFLLFYLGFLLRYFENIFLGNKKVHQALLLVLVAIIIGIKEPLALIMGFIAVLLFINSFYKIKNEHFFLTIQMIIAGIFIVFLMIAPGNEYRMANYTNNKNFSYSFSYTFMQMARFVIEWIGALSSVFLVFVVAFYHEQVNPLLKRIKTSWAISIFLSILFLCIFPAYWVTGILGQHRTLNIASLFFVLMAVYFGIRFGAYFQKHITFSFTKRVTIFCLVSVMVGNGAMVFKDIISGKVASYNQQLNERAMQIHQTKSAANLPKLINAPKSLFVVDVHADSTHWINQGYLLEYK